MGDVRAVASMPAAAAPALAAAAAELPRTAPAPSLKILHILRAPLGGLFRHVVDVALRPIRARPPRRPHRRCNDRRRARRCGSCRASSASRARCAARRHRPRARSVRYLGAARDFAAHRARSPPTCCTATAPKAPRWRGWRRARPTRSASIRPMAARWSIPRARCAAASTASSNGCCAGAPTFFCSKAPTSPTCFAPKSARRGPWCASCATASAKPSSRRSRLETMPRISFASANCGRSRASTSSSKRWRCSIAPAGGVSATIAGEGPQGPDLAAQARRLGVADQIRFVGYQPAREAFAMGRMLVLPSRAESLPYVVLEAAAAGVPIIATRVGGIPEIFGPQAEQLIAPDNVDALADAIGAALDGPAQVSPRGATGQIAGPPGVLVDRDGGRRHRRLSRGARHAKTSRRSHNQFLNFIHYFAPQTAG